MIPNFLPRHPTEPTPEEHRALDAQAEEAKRFEADELQRCRRHAWHESGRGSDSAFPFGPTGPLDSPGNGSLGDAAT